jgi:tol-pal system protein YbgF
MTAAFSPLRRFGPARPIRAAALLLAAGIAASPAAAAPGDDLSALPGAVGPVRTELAAARSALAATRAEASALAELRLAQLPQNYAAQVEVRLTELERRLQELTGEVEQLGYRLSQTESRLERALNDIEYRLSALEGGEPPGPGAGSGSDDAAGRRPAEPDLPETTFIGPEPDEPGADGGPAPESGVLGTLIIQGEDGVPRNPSPVRPPGESRTAALPPGNVQEQYDHAYGLLQQGDFAAAEDALSRFLRRHDDHPLASNAHYWLGETFYARSRFEDAAAAFARGYREYPDGAKAVDSLLKLGMSLARLGRTQDACLTLEQLSAEFPDGPAAIRRRADRERQRLQCG